MWLLSTTAGRSVVEPPNEWLLLDGSSGCWMMPQAVGWCFRLLDDTSGCWMMQSSFFHIQRRRSGQENLSETCFVLFIGGVYQVALVGTIVYSTVHIRRLKLSITSPASTRIIMDLALEKLKNSENEYLQSVPEQAGYIE